MNKYEVKIDIKFTQLVNAENKEKAIQQVKYSFADEYGIDVTDKEIIEVKEQSN